MTSPHHSHQHTRSVRLPSLNPIPAPPLWPVVVYYHTHGYEKPPLWARPCTCSHSRKAEACAAGRQGTTYERLRQQQQTRLRTLCSSTCHWHFLPPTGTQLSFCPPEFDGALASRYSQQGTSTHNKVPYELLGDGLPYACPVICPCTSEPKCAAPSLSGLLAREGSAFSVRARHPPSSVPVGVCTDLVYISDLHPYFPLFRSRLSLVLRWTLSLNQPEHDCPFHCRVWVWVWV